MGWRPGKSYYEERVEEALVQLSASLPLCADYRHNRSTWFSGRLRYDFVLGLSRPDGWITPYLIEVHGEQHYGLLYDYENDNTKHDLALQHGCPFLVIPYNKAYELTDELLELITEFVRPK